jgi:hypothetical protein
MKSYFLEELPTSLTIDGAEYPIQTDFRTVLRYDRLIHEGRPDGSELEDALVLMYGGIPANVVEAMLQLNWFIQCGQEEKKHKPSNQLLGINNDKPMDYDVDSRLIWAAFRRVYGIDLRAVEYLHWWDFQEMLAELPEDVRLNRIIEIRTKDTGNKRLSKEERTLYKTLQRYYKLREPITEKQEKLNEALRNGEDPTPYL